MGRLTLPTRRRRLAVTGSLVVVGLLIALFATTRARHAPAPVAGRVHMEPTTPGTARPGTRAPVVNIVGLTIDDISWTGPSHGFALGTTTGCGDAQRCPQVLLRTDDGAAHWSLVTTNKRPRGCAFGCARPDGTRNETHIRFASDEIGYAFGNAGFMTTDGGRTWARQPGPNVSALVIARTNAVRVTYTESGCPAECLVAIETAPLGSASWKVVRRDLPTGDDVLDLVADGSNVFGLFTGVTGGGILPPASQLIASHDAGRTWAPRTSPCAAETASADDDLGISAVSGSVVATCAPHTRATVPPGSSFFLMSRDGGRTFGPPRRIPPSPTGSVVTVRTATSLFASYFVEGEPGANGDRLYASRDGGRHWSVAIRDALPPGVSRTPPGGRLFEFRTENDGMWLGYGRRLWTTTDGGRTWMPRPIP